MTKLKPCPFCGGKAILVDDQRVIMCDNDFCDATMGQNRILSDERVVRSWNTRQQSLNQASQEDKDKIATLITDAYLPYIDSDVFPNYKITDAILKEYVLVKKNDSERCKHGVHGQDCFECYPPEDK